MIDDNDRSNGGYGDDEGHCNNKDDDDDGYNQSDGDEVDDSTHLLAVSELCFPSQHWCGSQNRAKEP